MKKYEDLNKTLVAVGKAVTERAEERQFTEHLNQKIQYDTTPREASLIAERSQYIYP